jgi:uncharacterized protein (TIGR02246 family)
MKPFMTLLLLAGLSLTGSTQPAEDRDEVRRVATAFFRSWNNHDFSDLATYTTSDVNFVMGMGVHWKSREEVLRAQVQNHQQVYMRTTTYTPEEVSLSTRFITDDVAVVNLVARISAFYPPDGVDRGNNRQGDLRVRFTLVALKQEGRWLLTAVQGTPINPEAEATMRQ